MSHFAEKLLSEAYQHYSSTGDFEYTIIPLDADHLINVYQASQTLYSAGYIDDLSDTLLHADKFSLLPVPDRLSFSITTSGIEKARGW